MAGNKMTISGRMMVVMILWVVMALNFGGKTAQGMFSCYHKCVASCGTTRHCKIGCVNSCYATTLTMVQRGVPTASPVPAPVAKEVVNKLKQADDLAAKIAHSDVTKIKGVGEETKNKLKQAEDLAAKIVHSDVTKIKGVGKETENKLKQAEDLAAKIVHSDVTKIKGVGEETKNKLKQAEDLAAKIVHSDVTKIKGGDKDFSLTKVVTKAKKEVDGAAKGAVMNNGHIYRVNGYIS